MSTQAELERKILAKLAKTGYPLEMAVSATLDEQGWLVYNNPAYLDEDEAKGREIDIRAHRAFGWDQLDALVESELLIECKTSDQPWVFFVRDEPCREPEPRKLKWVSPVGNLLPRWPDTDGIVDIEFLGQHHHYYATGPYARTFCEPLKGDATERSPKIYEGVRQATKACLYEIARRESFVKDHVFVYPVVIFSGNLFEAAVGARKSITLREARHVRLAFNFIPSRQPPPPLVVGRDVLKLLPDQIEFLVDVVHEDALRDYLGSLERFNKALVGRLREAAIA